MAYGKIAPILAAVISAEAERTDAVISAEAERTDAAITDAVNTPANANQRLTDGVMTAVTEYNKLLVTPSVPGNPALGTINGRLDRLERTLKEMCRTQMTLPKQMDFVEPDEAA